MNISKRHYLAILILFMMALAALPLLAQDATTTPEPPCQTYHLTVDQGRIRAEPSEDGEVIGGVNRSNILCIQGTADNNLPWLVIKLEDAEGGWRQGYISNTIVAPGEPGQIMNPEDYCDAWRTRGETIVRGGASTTFPILTELAADEIICVDDYFYVYRGWSNVYETNGASGWVRTNNLTYEYVEGACPNDESYRVITAATIHSEPGSGAATSISFPANTLVCFTGESEEDSAWVTFTMTDSEGQNGWVDLDLLEPVEGDLTQAQVATGTPPSGIGEATAGTCTNYRVIGGVTNIHPEPSSISAPLDSVGSSDTLCVLGLETAADSNNWYRINLAPNATEPEIGYVLASLLEPVESGDATSVAQVETSPTATLGGTMVDVSPTVAPTATPDGELPLVAQICPVGATPLDPNACVTATPTPIPGVPELSGNGLLLARDIPLSSLFIPNLELLSPESSIDFFFRLPQDWLPGTPTSLFLSIDYSESVTARDGETATGLSSRFDVRVDDILVSTINMTAANTGTQLLEIPIPDALMTASNTNFHTVEFTLSARDFCRVSAETRVNINTVESYLRFTYQEALPTLDLAFYPMPFFNNPIGNETESVIFVLPQNPSDGALEAVASIAAGLGKLTGDELGMRFVFDNELTPEEWQTSNLILIGEVSAHHQISDLYRRNMMPTTWDGSNLLADGQPLESDDGVMHLIANPDSAARAILVVTGQSDTAVAHAGQALGGKPSILGITGNTGIVYEARSLFRAEGLSAASPPGTYYVGEFNNNQDIVLTGVGVQVASIDFDVPLGGDVTQDAFIEILYNNSALLSGVNSSLSLTVNDVPITSVDLRRNLTEQPADAALVNETFRTLHAQIPEGVIEPGERNNVTIYADMQGDWGCDIPDASTIWVTISKQSYLYLPQQQSTNDELYPLMVQFPRPYNIVPDLSDILISMPDMVTGVEGTQLVEIMSYLGGATRFGEGFRPEIRRGAIEEEEAFLSEYNILVLGRPSNNSFLRFLNDSPPPEGMERRRSSLLPQPFASDSDDFVQVLDDVSYRLRDRMAVGVMQVFVSPWNPEKRVTVISGTEGFGQLAATHALLDIPFGRVQLEGDVVFATFNDAFPVDTRNIFDPSEILLVVPEVAGGTVDGTPSATALQVGEGTPSPIAATAQPTTDPLVAITFTPTPTNTPEPTATPFIPPTPTGGGQTSPLVLGIIGVSVLIALVGGAYTVYSELRPKKKDTL
jgi:hypothetical protein